MKDKILLLLNSKQLEDYLLGIQLLTANLTNADFQESIDAELLEKVWSVFVLEKWAAHEDYLNILQEFKEKLPSFQFLLNDSSIGYALKGISIFIIGLLEKKYDMNGFHKIDYPAYMVCNSQAAHIEKYFRAESNDNAANFFLGMSEFFGKINTAQFQAARVAQNLMSWDKSKAETFLQILVPANARIQQWMLESLSNVKKEPIIIEQIFDRYQSILTNIQKKYKEEGADIKLKHVNGLQDMIAKHR